MERYLLSKKANSVIRAALIAVLLVADSIRDSSADDTSDRLRDGSF